MKLLYPLFAVFIFHSGFLFAQPRHPVIWQKCFGGSSYEAANDAIINADETAIIVGYTNSSDGDVTGYHQSNNYDVDGWVIKLDTDGNIIWQKSLGGTAADRFLFVKGESNGSCYCIGYSSSVDGDVPTVPGENKLWIIKLDSSGNTTWSKVYDSVYIPTDATMLSDGGIAIIAIAVLRINSQGDLLWKSNPTNSFGNHLAEFNAGTLISSGGYRFNSVNGSYTLLNWNFSDLPFYALKTTDSTIFLAYEKFDSTTNTCNIFSQYLIKMTDTSGIYTESKWHSDCISKYGDWATETANSNGLVLLNDSSFVAVGKKTSPMDYYTSAFFYHNGFFSVYGTNIDNFSSVKAFAGERTFLCVGSADGYDDWDIRGNHNAGSSDMLVMKLARLTSSEWLGTKSSDWNDIDNWSSHEVPDAGTIVTITAALNSPVINTDAYCYSLNVYPNAMLTVNDGFKLSITGRKRVY